MDAKRVIITRKIQLLINETDEQEKRRTWDTLWQWQRICFKAANYIYTHHFIQEQVKELFYLNDEIRVKLADVHKDPDGILTTSRMNTTYQVMNRHFQGDIPMSILGCLNSRLVSYFNKEKEGYWKGERSLRNFKRTIPVPIPARAFKNMQLSENGKYYSFSIYGLKFCTYFGRDLDDKRVMWERGLKGEYKLCDSSLQLDKGKIFLLAIFQFEKQEKELLPDMVAEASLSAEIPITVKIGRARYTIGNREEFLYRRLAIQQALHRCQKGASFNRSKNGRARMLQKLKTFQNAEKRYISYKLHVYSRRLIDLCIKHRAATLILVNQEEKEAMAKGEQFLLRNWSYYSLREKIACKFL